MTDTTISDAIVAPQDDGTGVADGSEDFNSAAYLQLMSKYKGDGSYVGEDNTGTATLQFNDVDTTNEEVDVGTGYAYIMDGNHTVQSGSQSTYDTTLPINTPYVVILPTEVTNLGLGTDTDNDLWLAVDPTSNDSVYIRHGSGLSAPTDPNVKLGTVNTSDGSTTRPNDLFSATGNSATLESLSAGSITIGGSALLADGDFAGIGPTFTNVAARDFSTSNSSFTSDASYSFHSITWDSWVPQNATPSIASFVRYGGASTKDIRLLNATDDEAVWTVTVSGAGTVSTIDQYTPSTTASPTDYRLEVKSNDGGNATLDVFTITLGIEL